MFRRNFRLLAVIGVGEADATGQHRVQSAGFNINPIKVSFYIDAANLPENRVVFDQMCIFLIDQDLAPDVTAVGS